MQRGHNDKDKTCFTPTNNDDKHKTSDSWGCNMDLNKTYEHQSQGKEIKFLILTLPVHFLL